MIFRQKVFHRIRFKIVKEENKMEKIVQTAGRNALKEFSPEFAHYNDDVLFG